jgi:transposase
MNRCVTKPQALPDDVALLKAMVHQRDVTIASLNERLNVMIAQRFSASSERVSDAQLGLFNEAEQEADNDDEEQPTSETIEVPAAQTRSPQAQTLTRGLAACERGA